MTDLQFPTYDSIGLRPLINCRGTYTIISGSLLLPEARAAMVEASKQYVHLDELHEVVGKRIAELMQCEWGMVVNGCAAALCQIAAAAVAGADPEKMVRLPDTMGMANEVIVQKSHRHTYDHAVRMVGAKMIEVETRADLAAALNDRTALLLMFGDAAERGKISIAEMAEVGRERGIVTFVDAAAERPDVPNVYLADGVDAVGYSGGKCLRGPQSSGLILGRKQLLHTAFLNGAPHHAIGRPMKASKEEVMALLAAVEMWVRRDHEAEWKEWERRLDVIGDVVRDRDSVQLATHHPGRSNVAPVLVVEWDPAVVGMTGTQVADRLSRGMPRIEVFSSETGFSVNPYMMESGEEDLVANRLVEILVTESA
ncbi:MAG: aminotransferase class V-fold PLP-dependent enzyme [Candidatus Latescibacterota bacterium]|nr:aminotransferase class V-fold PLP-dependent enzyme [Candidatus Latescibacterota bacterium]